MLTKSISNLATLPGMQSIVQLYMPVPENARAYTESRNGTPRITERNEISESRNGMILYIYEQGY